MTDTEPTLADLLARIAALEARVAELEEDSPALDRARERRRYNLTRRMA